MDMYNSNKSEFFFSLKDIAIPAISFFVASFVMLLFIAFLVPKKIYKYYIALLYVLTICFYVQGNFLRSDFGLLNGVKINWSDYTLSSVVSALFWLTSVCSAFLFVKKKPKKTVKFLKYASLVILLVQIVVLAFSFRIKSDNNPKKAYLSIQNEYSVSPDNNVVVFILDCFDSSTMNEIVDRSDYDAESEFKDFTFYNNVTAGATRTKYAIPYIFTGVTNKEPVSYTEYLKKQFEKSILIKTLKEEDCDSSVFTVSNYIDTSLNDVFNNLVSEKKKVSSRFGLTLHFYKLVLFRHAPTPVKRFFWMYTGDFDRWILHDVEEKTPYVIDDVKYYENLKKTGLIMNNSEKSFRLFHLLGAHPPYSMTENVQRVKGGESDLIRQAIGSLKIVSTYLRELKRLNVYENATIIVMADHGSFDKEQNPLFMVKERGKRKDFSTDSMSLSYKDVPKMFSDAVRNEDLNIAQYDCKDNGRYFYQQMDENSITRLIEYEINGTASDKKNIKETGIVYYGDSNKDVKDGANIYKLGTNVFFTSEATGNKYAKKGFSKNEGTHTWTEGNESELLFFVKEKHKDLLLNLEYTVFNSTQIVDLYVNDSYVLSWEAKGRETKTLIIPREIVGNNKTIKVDFKFPNACSPFDLGINPDRRILALAFISLNLSRADLQEEIIE